MRSELLKWRSRSPVERAAATLPCLSGLCQAHINAAADVHVTLTIKFTCVIPSRADGEGFPTKPTDHAKDVCVTRRDYVESFASLRITRVHCELEIAATTGQLPILDLISSHR
jgi:hypothetical protein